MTWPAGKTWDVFYDEKKTKLPMDEITITLLKNRTIYLVSRERKSHKLEYFLNLKGEVIKNYGPSRKNHRGTWCHHGTHLLGDGRVLFASHNRRGRNDATIAIGDANAEKFETRQLYKGGGWGYCDVTYLPKEKAILMVGETEPIHPDTSKFIGLKDHYGPGIDNERFSLGAFIFSLDYYQTLNLAKVK